MSTRRGPRGATRLPLTLGVVLVALAVVAGFFAYQSSQDSRAERQSAAAFSSVPPTTPPPAGAAAPAGTSTPTTPTPATPRLGDNPVLNTPRAGLPNLDCPLPDWQSNPAAAQSFLTSAKGCLDRAWRPFVSSFGLPFTAASIQFPTRGAIATPCGSIEFGIKVAAYHCANTIYLPYDGLQVPVYGDRTGPYLALLAHEYGHQVQDLIGVTAAYGAQQRQAGATTERGQELGRRFELQAQCFSGMFLGAAVGRGDITKDMFDDAWRDQESRGDETSGVSDHGNNQHFAQWWRAGASSNRIDACNTWTASADQVS